MLTAILVDDDYPVIRYLSQAVSWSELGIELTGCYYSGLEAWEKARQNPPDLIITDIGMPKMNGLEMLEKFRAMKPGIRAIILSCHNEFKYAQQALKLNVGEYILKESLNIEQLEHALRTLVKEVGLNRQQHTEMLVYKQKQSQNRAALKEKFLKDTLYQSWDKVAWIEQARSNGIMIHAKTYIPMLIVIDRPEEASRVRRMSEYTISFAVENIMQEVLEADHSLFISRYSHKEIVILFCNDQSSRDHQAIYHSIQNAASAVQKYLKLSVSCIFGAEARSPEEIRGTLQRMLKEKIQRFYFPAAGIHRFEEISFSRDDIYAEYGSLYADINDDIALNRETELRIHVKEWREWVATQKFHPNEVKECVLRLLMDLQLKTKQLLQSPLLMAEEKLFSVVSDIDTLEHLEEWLVQYLEELARKISIFSIKSKRSEVIKAQQFVISHVTEKITLEDMAGRLNLNASYFSRLFKRETNQNFIEYVNMLKLQKAKELLNQSGKTVEEISEYLGYANKSYFIKLFKREMGMRPSEYAAWH